MGFFTDLYGGKPQAATFNEIEYEPIDYGDQQIETIEENVDAFPFAQELLGLINPENTVQGIDRIEALAPGFMGGVSSMADTAQSLLRGELPFDDVLEIVRDGQNLRNTIGTPGTHGAATLRDLGISRLGAMQSGSEFLARTANIAEQVDPVGRQSTVQDWLLAPAQTVPLKQEDAQFAAEFALKNAITAYNADQNALNAAAAPDPTTQGLVQLGAMAVGGVFGGAAGAAMGGSLFGGGGGGGGGAGISGLAYPGGGGGYGGGGGGYGGYGAPSSGYFNPDAQFSTKFSPQDGGLSYFGK